MVLLLPLNLYCTRCQIFLLHVHVPVIIVDMNLCKELIILTAQLQQQQLELPDKIQ